MAHRTGATLESVEVTGDIEAQFAVTTVRPQVDTYHTPDADEIRVVRTESSMAALPVSGSAAQTLTPQDESTDVRLHGVVTANIPFVGTMVAEAAEPFIGKVLALRSQEAEV